MIYVKDNFALANFLSKVMIMTGKPQGEVEYRGYTLIAIEQSPGWRVHIYPGPGLLHTRPDAVDGVTKEDGFAKARAAVDHRLTD